jgi:GNAT superfamily N-acetyltransferase
MNDKLLHNTSQPLLKRVFNLLINEGFSGVGNRIKERLQSKIPQIHLFVMSAHFDHSTQKQEEMDTFDTFGDSRYQFMQVLFDDYQAIDELSVIDVWGGPKSELLEKLQEGWNCYVIKLEGRIVVTGWVCMNQSFIEPHMKRELNLAADEVYHWRGFTVPEVRGKGLMPWYLKSLCRHLAESYGKTRHLTMVRVNNKPIQQSLGKSGWESVGRAGFYDFYGFRFHYLIGCKAFSCTKKHFCISRLK